ncbi:hypothetical protein LSUE1_G000764 [Lachnellula suecica]|uniref:Uncharacterized protein n=1 Tax=Lachnellula suecica TaxID=602035 RepID=A0A8T9CH72_9HELO|nr:hypothetical protein LSUE1_G000764 [Lachnellula suecica]
MQGHHISATAHIQSGVKLLRETGCDQRNGMLQHQALGSKSYVDTYVLLDVIADIFSGLGTQVRLVIGGENLKRYEVLFFATAYDDLPLSFTSIQEAKNMFQYGRCLFNNSAAQSSSNLVQDPPAVETLVRFQTLTLKFSLALREFIKSNSLSFTPKEDIAVAVLQLHVLSGYISMHLGLLPSTRRPHWTEFITQFEEMIALGEKIVASISPGNSLRGQTTSYCLDLGFVIPIYSVAIQCRDPILRRKAIALLRSTPRQEGLWNSVLIAKAAERIMEIEEGSSEETQSCTTRLDLEILPRVRPTLELDEKGGRLKYTQQGQTNAAIHVVEEVFSWEAA